MIRRPAVAGSFYSGDAAQLKSDIESFVIMDCKKQAVLGIVSPHAGYVYSGRVAGNLYSRIKIPNTVVILAPIIQVMVCRIPSGLAGCGVHLLGISR